MLPSLLTFIVIQLKPGAASGLVWYEELTGRNWKIQLIASDFVQPQLAGAKRASSVDQEFCQIIR